MRCIVYSYQIPTHAAVIPGRSSKGLFSARRPKLPDIRPPVLPPPSPPRRQEKGLLQTDNGSPISHAMAGDSLTADRDDRHDLDLDGMSQISRCC